VQPRNGRLKFLNFKTRKNVSSPITTHNIFQTTTKRTQAHKLHPQIYTHEINSLGHQARRTSPFSRAGAQAGRGIVGAAPRPPAPGAALRVPAGGGGCLGSPHRRRAPFTFGRKHLEQRIRYLGIPNLLEARLKFQKGLELAPRPHPRGGGRAGAVGRRWGPARLPGTAAGRRWPAQRRGPGAADARGRPRSSRGHLARAGDPGAHRGSWREGTAETTWAGVQGPAGITGCWPRTWPW
jgi:hypothetical protein